MAGEPLDLGGFIGPGVQAATGAATGNPIALAAGVAGMAMSIFGGVEQSQIQKQEAGVSADIAQQEEAINKQRQELATLTYQRQSTENMRNAQMAGARAKAAAVGQGAQFGSGAIAGQEQARSQEAFNQQGLYQNYKIGQNIFGLTSNIDADQIKLAQLGGQAATAGGISAIGGGLTQGAMAFGRLSGGFGGQG